jgi:hypothetical protein
MIFLSLEKKKIKILKEDNETEVLSENQTAEEVQNILIIWKNIMMI